MLIAMSLAGCGYNNRLHPILYFNCLKMKTSNIVVLQLAILVFLVIHEGLAIQCLNCSSVDDPRCGDPFQAQYKDMFLTDCISKDDNPNGTICRKIDQTVNGDHRIFRRCAWEDHKKYDCYFGTSQYYKTESCVCRTDGCNSAPYGQQPSAWFSFFTIIGLLSVIICIK
ncbi:hypothetical protein CHUAL_005081 [Chamberlinius hualienensis]